MRISDWSSDVCSSDLLPVAAIVDEAHDSDPVPVDFVQQQERMVGDGPLPDPRSHDRRAELGMLNQKTGGRKNGFQHFDARAHAFGVKKIGSPKQLDRKSTRLNSSH